MCDGRFLGFIGIVLYPVDIGYSINDKVANPKLRLIWAAVYWFTFFLSWVGIPIMSESEVSCLLESVTCATFPTVSPLASWTAFSRW